MARIAFSHAPGRKIFFAKILNADKPMAGGFTWPKRYINVMIPVELADEVDKILEKKLLGYRSRAEFVAESVRDKLIQVKK